MDTKIIKKILLKEDLQLFNIWQFNEDNLYIPVLSKEELSSDSYDWILKSKFLTANGVSFEGYTIGVKNIFCIVIFYKNKIFAFNKHELDWCYSDLDKLNQISCLNLTMNEFSPLTFTTDFEMEGLHNISGEFDILKKMTLEEQLWQVN